MGCDNCYWNAYCSEAEQELNINGSECSHFDDMGSDSMYSPTREEFYKDFYKYIGY